MESATLPDSARGCVMQRFMCVIVCFAFGYAMLGLLLEEKLRL